MGLDTDTVQDTVLVDMGVTVLVDMGVTVLALPAMEVTVLDTVSGRDLLMPGMDVDMVDTAVATVDTVVEDMDTESKFYASINLLPFILISSHFTYLKQCVFPFLPQKQNQIIFRHVSSKVEESFE